MVAAITIAIFIVAYVSGKEAAMMLAAIISCCVPDELPFVDEVIETAIVVKFIINKSKLARSSNLVGEQPALPDKKSNQHNSKTTNVGTSIEQSKLFGGEK